MRAPESRRQAETRPSTGRDARWLTRGAPASSERYDGRVAGPAALRAEALGFGTNGPARRRGRGAPWWEVHTTEEARHARRDRTESRAVRAAAPCRGRRTGCALQPRR